MTEKKKSWKIPLTLTLVLLGFLLSVQFKVQQDLVNTLNMQKTEDLVAMLRGLHDKKSTLELEIHELLEQIYEFENNFTADAALYNSMDAEIQRLKIASGSVDVQGPGISVIIYGDSQLLYLDLIDIINELWASGAEVVAINDQRFDLHTRIYDTTMDGSLKIMVNDQVLLYPIVIQAIGDPHTLETGLTFSGGIIDNLATLYNIHPEIKREAEIIIPAGTNTNKLLLQDLTSDY